MHGRNSEEGAHILPMSSAIAWHLPNSSYIVRAGHHSQATFSFAHGIYVGLYVNSMGECGRNWGPAPAPSDYVKSEALTFGF